MINYVSLTSAVDRSEGFSKSEIFLLTVTHLWITFAMVGGYCLLLPLWITIVLRNKYTKPILTSGWVPVLSALLISG